MRVGSLFSGIGGIELGLERTGGFETAWFVENDRHAQAILRKHWPAAQIYDDVTTVDFGAVPPIDILTGGFPCQDISNAGKRAGIEGSRSGLWRYCVEAIRVLRPRIAFFENVAAITDRGLNVVLADLAAIGYDAEWHCVPASAVGAPHRRDRIIILAYPDGGRHLHGQAGEQSDQGRQPSQHDAREGSQDVDYSNEERWKFKEANGELERKRFSEPSEYDRNQRQGVWFSEPDVGRVAHGVPHRVDRIKRLGNAVVPQWAQAVGHTIKEAKP